MRDFGLPLLLPMLQGQPGRQRLVLQVVRGRVRVRVTVRATVRVRARGRVSPNPDLVLQVVYAFSADTPAAHVGVIKGLQEALDQQATFLYALTSLVALEATFSDDLLDLYIYYGVIGLGMTSCRLRAASLSMLPVLAASDGGAAVVLQVSSPEPEPEPEP